jgi:hypothetical protein
MGFFLWIYPSRDLRVPLGWDTARYLWRTGLVQAFGFAGLEGAVPAYVNPDPSRPGFPVLAATLGSLGGVSTFRIAAVLPAVAAASAGLAAAAFVSVVLRRAPWQLALVAIGVGTSFFVVRLAGPEAYQDNLFAAAVFMAASALLALAIRDRRALLPAILLLGSGGVIHWAFFLFMAATVALTALLYLPSSIRSWRGGRTPLLGTPSGRLGEILVGGSAIAGAAILGVLGATPRQPTQSREEFTAKLARSLAGYSFPVVLPLAAAGALSLASEERASHAAAGNDGGDTSGNTVERGTGVRFALLFLLAWCGIVLAGILANVIFRLRVPAHRFLAFALAVPVLGALGLVWVSTLVARIIRPRRLARIAAAVLILATLGGAVWASGARWSKVRPWMDAVGMEQGFAAAGYLSAADVGLERPVVFIVGNRDESYAALSGHMIRASQPAPRVAQIHLFAGAPQDYLARRPTMDTSGGGLPGLSARYFRRIEDTFARDPVALILRSFNRFHYERWIIENPDTVVAPGVSVVRGTVMRTPIAGPATPLGRFTSVHVAVLSVGSLAALGFVGLGWTVVLFRRWSRRLETLALSPAVGMAFLVLGGIVADRFGVRLTGWGGALVVVAVAALGWALAVPSLRRSVVADSL